MLADSSAVLCGNRILPQHQSAIMLMTTMLQNPSQTNFSWLDLACGKGQIISQLSANIDNSAIREKIRYLGYDIDPNHTRIAGNNLCNMGLGSYDFLHGDLSGFPNLVTTKGAFDFITCTNTAHEIKPKVFSSLIVESIIRLSEPGVLFIHDMESLDNTELGALTWHGSEIGQLLNTIFEVVGIEYRVFPNVWKHTSCNTWTVVVQRQLISITNAELQDKRDVIDRALSGKTNELLSLRLVDCCKTLQHFRDYGKKTDEEKKIEKALVYELYALKTLGIT